jgi:hypothetical protein
MTALISEVKLRVKRNVNFCFVNHVRKRNLVTAVPPLTRIIQLVQDRTVTTGQLGQEN